MQLYAGRTRDFVHAATHNAIARRLADAFLAHYRRAAGDAEFHSWQNSLRALSSVIEIGHLHETGIALEYQLPLSSLRLDGKSCIPRPRRTSTDATWPTATKPSRARRASPWMPAPISTTTRPCRRIRCSTSAARRFAALPPSSLAPTPHRLPAI
jgi:hypothetical protein